MPDLISAEEAGRLLRPARPLSPSSARKELHRAGIAEVRGYPRSAVDALVANRIIRERRQVEDHPDGHLVVLIFDEAAEMFRWRLAHRAIAPPDAPH